MWNLFNKKGCAVLITIDYAPVGRPKVLRSCDMEYGMLHLIFSLPHMPGEGQNPQRHAASAV